MLAGDGTLNEAAGGLAGPHVALAPLPGGSTNVFARTLGIAYEPEAAAPSSCVDVARGAGRTAASASARPRTGRRSSGTSSSISASASTPPSSAAWRRGPYVKRYFAHPAFAVATVDTWLRHYDRTTRIAAATASGRRATGDDVVGAGPYAVISNSDPYTYVGRRPLHIAPGASLDAALTVTVLRTCGARWCCARPPPRRRHGSLPRHLARDRAARRRRGAWRSAATRRSPGRSTATTSARSSGSTSRYAPDCAHARRSDAT